MIPIVYLGPSLPLPDAKEIIRADFRPPVRRGDLARIQPKQLVVIIDGEFGQSLSVSPREILQTIESGSTVIGASSMGALRAAELHPFGMRGVGWVYEGYRSGRITGDDEVAVGFSSLDEEAVTVPLVNVRFWAEELVGQGLLSSSEGRKIIRRARSIFFLERSRERLYPELEDLLGTARFRTLLRVSGGDVPDIKSKDCRMALELAASLHSKS